MFLYEAGPVSGGGGPDLDYSGSVDGCLDFASSKGFPPRSAVSASAEPFLARPLDIRVRGLVEFFAY